MQYEAINKMDINIESAWNSEIEEVYADVKIYGLEGGPNIKNFKSISSNLMPWQKKTLLAKYYSLLKPGGSVLLDVYSLNSFNQKEESATYELNQLNGFWSPDDYYCFVNTFKYDEEKVSLDKYTIVEESGTRVVYNWLQYFSPETLEKEFVESGFMVEKIYSDVAGTTFNSESKEFAVIVSKS